MQASVGSERPLAPRRHLQLDLPCSQLGGDAAAVETPKNGSLAAMLASLWEGKATAAQSGTIGASSAECSAGIQFTFNEKLEI